MVVWLLITGDDGEPMQRQSDDARSVYTIDQTTEPVAAGHHFVTKSYSRNGNRVLSETIRLVPETGKRISEAFIFGQASYHALKEDIGQLPESHITMHSRMSVFGWYGEKNKSMFQTFFPQTLRTF